LRRRRRSFLELCPSTPTNSAFSFNSTQVCYDDDYDVCTYVVRELPKVLLDAQRKPIEPPAKAWAALGLSAAFVKASRAAFTALPCFCLLARSLVLQPLPRSFHSNFSTLYLRVTSTSSSRAAF
jgi:hypothetical protein